MSTSTFKSPLCLNFFGLSDAFYALIVGLRELFSPKFSWQHVQVESLQFEILATGKDFIHSIELYKCYEPEMSTKFISVIKHCNSLIDVGCSFGYYSVLAAKVLSPEKIHSFDLSKTALWAFNKTFKKNKLPLPHIHKKYLGCGDETRNHTSLSRFLDEFDLNKPICIKIDVEGFELIVLEGLCDKSSDFDLHILLEIHPAKIININPSGLDNLSKFIEDNNFKLEICKNHRGPHRGPSAPWIHGTIKEFLAIANSYISNGENFAIYLYK